MTRAMILGLVLALGAPLAGAAQEPYDAASLVWHPQPGAQLPLDTVLRDETGRSSTLADMFGRTPVILDLGYFHCPSLCGLVRADLLGALQSGRLREGRDYTLISLSIDPAETPADAAAAKAVDLAQSPGATGVAWHYLTGAPAAVDGIEQAVGFREHYDAKFRQFFHPAGLVVLTKAGIVSGYLLGVGYKAGDLRAGLLRAEGGGIAQATMAVLLLCFHVDSTTGRYTLAIEKVLRLMALLSVFTIGGLLVLLHRRRRPG